MSDLSIPMALVVTLIGMIFSAGVTWGIVSTRQKSNNTSLTALAARMEASASRLETLVTDMQVAKSVSARFEKDLESQNDRLRELETQVAKLTR